ncbi:cadherin-like domain-containing protein, partial [Candidatus Poribacteria bacterium]|nr:cadherin-like domain-containing protein [Candidatus Poribacteria bacterium]
MKSQTYNFFVWARIVVWAALFTLPLGSAFAQTELVTNGGFESQSTGWVLSGNFYADSRFTKPHSGAGYAYVSNPDGTSGDNLNGSIYQSVTIPANTTSATLTFWYNITSQETGNTANDVLKITIQNSTGSVLATVATYSNLNKDPAAGNPYYHQKTFDMTLYKGQTVRVHFLGTTNGSLPTTFRIDDVGILAALSTLPGSFTLTATSYCNTTPPVAPAVMLRWTKSQGATNYQVYRNGSPYSSVLSSNILEFDNNLNIVAGQTYQYFIQARNDAGNQNSPTITVTVPINICPSPPGSFTLTATSYCNTTPPVAPAVMLRWTESQRATSYQVYRNGSPYGSVLSSSTLQFDNNLNVVAGQTYQYFIQARNDAGNQDSPTITVTVSINICPEEPTITGVSPVVGSNDRQWITINGNGFVSGFTVTLRDVTNSVTYPTITDSTRLQFINSTQVKVYANVSANPATWSAKVTNSNGAASNEFNFPVVAPVPTMNGLNPGNRTAGSSGFTLTVNGSNFNLSSVVRWNGSNRTTTPVETSPGSGLVTSLQASISASDIATAGTVQVTVSNPSPGGGISNPLPFTVDPPPLPDLTVSATVANNYTSGQGGVQIPVKVTRTGGNLTLGTYVDTHLFWSTNSTWDGGDTQLWRSNNSTPDFPNSYLNTNGSNTVTAIINIPSVPGGSYYIIAVVDLSDFYAESNDNNNVSAYPVSISIPPITEVTVAWGTPPPSTLTSGQTFSVSWKITGGTSVSHTNIHWDTIDPTDSSRCNPNNNPPCSNNAQNGSPGTYNDSKMVAPTVPISTVYKYVVHAKVDGVDYWSQIAPITVIPPTTGPIRLRAPWNEGYWFAQTYDKHLRLDGKWEDSARRAVDFYWASPQEPHARDRWPEGGRGKEVVAAHSGKVSIGPKYKLVDDQCVQHPDGHPSLRITSPDGYTTEYIHLDFDSAIGGKTVTVGEVIGRVAALGCTTTPHLMIVVYRGELTSANALPLDDPNGILLDGEVIFASGERIQVRGPTDDYGQIYDYTAMPRTATTGPLQVNATLNGASWSGSVAYQLTGPQNIDGAAVPQNFTSRPTGSYTLSYLSGGPSGATLSNITPSTTQSLEGSGTILYTLNFTTANKNPTSTEIANQIKVFAQQYQIPSVIIAAVIQAEGTGWKQFDDNGEPIIGPTGDVGLMQINVNNPALTFDVQRVRTDWIYNLETGCRILKEVKFDVWAKDTVSPYDSHYDTLPDIIENWYYPAAWYNGEGIQAYEYVTNIWNYLITPPPPANNFFSGIALLGNPQRLPDFPNTIYTDIPYPKNSLDLKSATPQQLISHGMYTLLLLVQDGQRVHRWKWDTSSVEDITDQIATPPALTAPTNLTATAVSSSQIDLSWQDNADNETGVKIERKTDNVSFTQIATVGANVTNYSDTGLGANTYTYRVRATSATGESDWSNEASASPLPVATSRSVTTVEDTAILITLTGSDPDKDPLTFTVMTQPANGTLTGTAPNLTYTPNLNFNGSDSFTFKANDGKADSASATVSITVTSVNDPPVFDPIANQTVLEDASATTLTVTGIGPGGGSDEAGQTVALTAASSNPAIVPNPTFNGSALTFQPVANANGTITITVTAKDNGGTANGGQDTFSRTFTITVTAVNDAPVFDPIEDVTVPPVVPVTITGVGPGGGADEAGQTVTLTARSDNTSVVLNLITISGSGATRTLTFTPAANANGKATITVTVTDNGPTGVPHVNTFSRTFTITVTPGILSIVAPTANQILPAGTTSTTLTVAIQNHTGAWHWKLNDPFPTSGPAGGSRVASGNTVTMAGLKDGQFYTVYIALVDGKGDVLNPPGPKSITFYVGATPVLVVEGAIRNPDGSPAEAGLNVTVSVGGNLSQNTSTRADGSYTVTFLDLLGIVAKIGVAVTVSVSRAATGESAVSTVILTSQQIIGQKTTVDVTFTEPPFDLTIPQGISLIHIPLKVTQVDGKALEIKTIGDLYADLGGSANVNFIITRDAAAGIWQSYLGEQNRRAPADRTLTDDMGIITVMKNPVTLRLKGDALGVDGKAQIHLQKGTNLVGVPLRSASLNRVSDLLNLAGIKGNATAIIVSDAGTFKVVSRPGDPGDIALTGGQSFIVTARQAGVADITGVAWDNVSGRTSAAPLMALIGHTVDERTPVLAVHGAVIDEVPGTARDGFRIIVKNLSTGAMLHTISGSDTP